jgi:hypothetical protein
VPRTTFDLRRLPAALGLSLPAALLAHLATFGNQHAAGGASHGALLALGASLVAGALTAGWLLAWSGTKATADGSVLAERLGRFVPSFVQLLVAVWATFGMIEWLEPQHGQLLAPLVLPALAITVWLARVVVVGLLRVLAAIAVAIASGELRAPAPFALRFIDATPLAVRAPLRGRLVARAPPIA